ncbi:COX15/CtaA family protein [Chitinophagaceae bacterium 26-R-25]|nr:COX15/CtaA family protein [Chitinophagaceae bacterium 26-R-25]
MELNTKKGNKAVAIWLLIGVGMIIIQVLLGGITRLTGSGLSITEWKPILGAVPPTSEAAWQHAFDTYKQIGQYKYLNTHFTLSDFKFIYFWEWFHREWARLIGVVFAVGFVYLVIKKYLNKDMVRPMVILFVLGGLQGAIGWIMVSSGLNEENLYVNHIRLAIHFIAALGLLVYTLWFAFQLLVPENERIVAPSLRKFTGWMIAIVVLQLIYGAFMAGLKAATFAPTWPTINGEWVPSNITTFGNRTFSGLQKFTDNPFAVHFIHRTLAYIITILVVIWFAKAAKINAGKLFKRTQLLPLAVVLIQVLLGILTVLNAANSKALLWLGITHQFVAMMLLIVWVWELYLLKKTTS